MANISCARGWSEGVDRQQMRPQAQSESRVDIEPAPYSHRRRHFWAELHCIRRADPLGAQRHAGRADADADADAGLGIGRGTLEDPPIHFLHPSIAANERAACARLKRQAALGERVQVGYRHHPTPGAKTRVLEQCSPRGAGR